MARFSNPESKRQVLAQVSRIPSGSVVTYGDIGTKVGLNPRVVGSVMAGLSDVEIEQYPWWRVVGAGGTIPALKYGFRGQVQINLLKDEKIEFSKRQKIVDFINRRQNI